MDGKKIACRYLRFWFWIDVISVFPFDLVLRVTIDSSTAGSIVLVRSLRLLRLLRLLKTLRIKRYFNSWLSEGRAVMHPTAWRLARGGAWLVLLAHLVACGAFGVCRAEGFPSDSWATVQGLEPGSGASWSEQYVASLYWALMTITTVGYGDISMARTAERLYAISCMLLGAVFFAYIVSSLSQLVREMDANNVLMRQRMDSINSYMHYRRLPLELRGRIRRYFTFFWSRQSIFDEQALLASLPAHLRRETALYLHKDMISKVPFLKEADNCFISSLVMELMPVQASPGDFLMIVGEVGMDMQFIDFGRVQIWAADMTILYRTLGPGDYFGEIALLTRERRTANCKAVTHVELWSLSRESLARLFADSPEMEQKLEQMARQRLALQMKMALESKLAKEPAQERAANVEEASEDSRSPLYPTDENLNHHSAGAAEAQSNGTEKVNETMIRALKKLQSRRMLQQTLQQMQQDDFDADNDREFLSAGTSARSFVRPAHGASLGGSHSASRGVTPERVRRPSICSFGPTPSIHSADNDRAFCNSTIGSAPMGGTTPSRVRMTLPDPMADDLDGGIFSTLHKKQLRHAMSNHALDADARDEIEETLHGLQAQQRQTAESVKTMLNVCARLEKAVAALTESRLADEQRKAVELLVGVASERTHHPSQNGSASSYS